jgi:hypothetical protein
LARLAARFCFTPDTMAVRLSDPRVSSSSRAASSSRAMVRFWLRERVAWDLTTMPVGMWRSWTAELVLFCLVENGKGINLGSGECVCVCVLFAGQLLFRLGIGREEKDLD